MKIGRNDPCPCGSGVKSKKCCLGEEVELIHKCDGGINTNGMFPSIGGFENMPDLKHFLNIRLQKSYFNKKFNPDDFFQQSIQEYNQLMEEINSKLPKQYGEILNDIKEHLEKKEFDLVIKKADEILCVFPESVEAQMYKDETLLSQNLHAYNHVFPDLLPLKGKDKNSFLEKFRESFRNSSPTAKRFIYDLIQKEMQNDLWSSRYAALDLLKTIIFLEMDGEKLPEFCELLISTLKDDEGRVRNNALYCVSHLRASGIAGDLFFLLYEEAQKEENPAKKKNLCRAILEMVSPILDQVMAANKLSEDYNSAIEMALKNTGYDQTYYKGNFIQKMMHSLTNHGRGKY